MAPLNQKLDDKFLIDFLKKEQGRIQFLSEETVKIISKFPDTNDKTQLKDIFDTSKIDPIIVLNLWERLLIDAIKYLKWHDLTEFPPNKRPPDLKSAYGIISEGSLGVYSLKDYFKTFIEFERLLYGAEQFYRDHVYHLIRVWLTGQFLLFNSFDDKFPIDIFDHKDIKPHITNIDITEGQDAEKKLNISRRNNGVLFEGEEDAIWCIIALTHDLGYPLGMVDKINDNLKKMMKFFAKTKLDEFSFAFPQQNQFINDAILKYLSSRVKKSDNGVIKRLFTKTQNAFSTHIQAKYYLKFSRSFERFDHGLISCLVLAKNLVYFLETNFDFDNIDTLKGEEEARQFIIRREILRSIASHTCHEIYHFKPNTFSFLLLIVDEIQFWGRPTFDLMAFHDPGESVTLNEFSETMVSIDYEFKQRDAQYKQKSLVGFFKAKVEMFNKILRIGVDSTEKKFTLEFTVKDETLTTYKYEAKPGSHPVVTINGIAIPYEKFLKILPFIEEDQSKLKDKITEYQTYFPKIIT